MKTVIVSTVFIGLSSAAGFALSTANFLVAAPKPPQATHTVGLDDELSFAIRRHLPAKTSKEIPTSAIAEIIPLDIGDFDETVTVDTGTVLSVSLGNVKRPRKRAIHGIGPLLSHADAPLPRTEISVEQAPAAAKAIARSVANLDFDLTRYAGANSNVRPQSSVDETHIRTVRFVAPRYSVGVFR